MENGTINVLTGDEEIVIIFVSLALKYKELYSLVEQFIHHQYS